MPFDNQYVMEMVVNISIRRRPRVIMNVSVRNIVLLTNISCDLTNFTILKPLSLLS